MLSFSFFKGRERRASGVVQPPDVNESVYAFRVSGAMSIRYGIGAIKGVGASAVEAIIEERTRNGAFSSLSDLCLPMFAVHLND